MIEIASASFRVTPYGEVDIAALDRMRAGFDTSQLLRLVEGLDACLSEMGGITALRDELLKLHAMALTIVEGTAPAAPTENACIWAEAESVQLGLEALAT
ncbi:Tn3 family transposase post-transcriptional regulator TnpC, partial [Pseudomonas aeruginosa]